MASLDTKDDKLHRALNMITEAVGILQNSPRSSQDIMADCIYFPHRGGGVEVNGKARGGV